MQIKKMLLQYLYLNNKNIKNISSLASSSLDTINPDYISGLTQADGSFSCGIQIIDNGSKGKRLRFTPKFEIVVDLDSKLALNIIQKYFGCGKVVERQSDFSARFIVTNLDDLRNIIIPNLFFFLNKNQEKKQIILYFNKLHAFNLFELILELLTKKHKERDNVAILRCAISMNKSSRRTEEEINELSQMLGCSQPVTKIQDNIIEMTSK